MLKLIAAAALVVAVVALPLGIASTASASGVAANAVLPAGFEIVYSLGGTSPTVSATVTANFQV